ncbi:MAG: hypothetical protein KKD59_06550, partial [Acidobacteria bacterium]|nr:hypothetical protein [Acidobacteriota bacterium]
TNSTEPVMIGQIQLVNHKNPEEAKKIILENKEKRHLQAEIKYEGYLKRQDREIAKIQKSDREKIPSLTPFERIPGLSREIVEQLKKQIPSTLGEAKKIPGITPAAVSNIQIYLKLQKKKKKD